LVGVVVVMQSENETVVKFGCRALFEVCLDDNNRAGMTAAGAGECLVALLKIHAPNIPVAQVVQRLSRLSRS
jgi:hypothetical protein